RFWPWSGWTFVDHFARKSIGDRWQTFGERWRLQGHKLVAVGRAPEENKWRKAWIAQPFPSSRLVLEFRFRVADFPSELGVFFCGDGRDQRSGYHFWLHKQGIKLGKPKEDDVHHTKDWQLRPRRDYTVRVSKTDGRLSIEIDGKSVFEWEDHDYQAMQIDGNDYIGFGFMDHGGEMRYVKVAAK
ncbi:MAG: hypothetical protein J7M38_08675, partial [Armatimonadetes bacterium]|nr:hypothetical protein [Armatimonadota bacterium]